MRFDNTTIALFGDTGGGKTYLEAELITHIKETKKQRSVVYMSDRGWKTLLPQIKAGLVLPVPLIGDPFTWLTHVVKGEILVNNVWTKPPDDIGLFAYDSGTGIGYELNKAIRASHSSGLTRQGDDGKVKTAGIGPAANTYKVGAENKASLDKGHFGIMQNELRDAIWQSQDLPGYILWTFLALRKQDDDTKAEIIGADLGVGKALTASLPSWFHYTFNVESSVKGTEEVHTLYTVGHADLSTGNAKVSSNARVPFGADKPTKTAYTPASLVQALTDLEGGQNKAADLMKKKYGV